MLQPWSPFRATMSRPALPPPRLTADVYETAGGEAYVLEIPVPGRTPDEITLEATSDMVTVAVRPREPEPEPDRTYLQREQRGGPMSRIFEFPAEIDTDGIQATLQHGILKVRVPKAAASRRKVIALERSA